MTILYDTLSETVFFIFVLFLYYTFSPAIRHITIFRHKTSIFVFKSFFSLIQTILGKKNLKLKQKSKSQDFYTTKIPQTTELQHNMFMHTYMYTSCTLAITNSYIEFAMV